MPETKPSQMSPTQEAGVLQAFPIAKARPAPSRLVQLSDPHLFAEPTGHLLGITTRSSFQAVIDLALAGRQAAHALILTGDLVHDESPAGYRYLRQALEKTGLP